MAHTTRGFGSDGFGTGRLAVLARTTMAVLGRSIRSGVGHVWRAVTGALGADQLLTRGSDRSVAPPVDARGDRWRQVLNVLGAVGQIAAIVISYVAGPAAELNNRTASEPPVVPALYTFSVWFVIYLGALVYAVFQALPAQRNNPLLRRIGWWTAAAFAATAAWAIVQAFGWLWLTVVCIFWMFAALIGALAGVVDLHAPHTRAERWCVTLPLGIFAGYVTLATIANTASVMTQLGINPGGLPQTLWATIMLAAAGLIGSGVTRWSRGNAGYALTVVWGLVGVVVANIQTINVPVAAVAGAMAALVAVVLVRVRASAPLPRSAT